MTRVSQELLNSLNLPSPPVFRLRQDSKLCYKVPDFCGYECPSTRWILSALTNRKSLKRFIKSGRKNENIFNRYYQIPDRPIELMGSDSPHENPAYHMQCVLYLTPLALAIYLKRKVSVEMILQLKNEAGHKIVHPSEACFVQKVFKKDEKRLTNELYNTFPIIIAIRRGFYEGISLLVENGFLPQRQFSILYRKPFRESISLFRDVLDYLVELLYTKPGLNVTKISKILLEPTNGLSTYDIFVYDVELDDKNNWDYVSIFRRVCEMGYRTKYFIEESSIQVINILVQIQLIGYFGGVDSVYSFYNGTPPDIVYKEVSPEVANELNSERLSVIMSKVPTIVKATREDLLNLDKVELEKRIHYDYQCCIGILFLWFQRCIFEENCGHYAKLVSLLSRIMLDTKIIEDFFVKDDEELATIFSDWANDCVKCDSVSNFRIKLQDTILFTDHLCIAFLNQYGTSPISLLKAPMVHGRSTENSNVIRELMGSYHSCVSGESEVNLNVNQSHGNQGPSAVDLKDLECELPIKFIPANYARNFTQFEQFNANFDDCSRDSSLNKNLNNANSRINLKTLPAKDIKCALSKNTPTYDTISIGSYKASKPPKVPKSNCQWCNHAQKMHVSCSELKTRLQHLVTTNEKYRNIKLSNNNKKVPLNSLRLDIQKFRSVNKIVKRIQNKIITRLESLYHNLDARAMMEIMRKLSSHSKSSRSSTLNKEFYRLFQSRI